MSDQSLHTLEDIREALFQAPDEWFDPHTLCEHEVECVHLSKSGIAAILTLLNNKIREVALEVIGEDEEAPRDYEGSAFRDMREMRNELRQEQRERLDKLFGGKEE